MNSQVLLADIDSFYKAECIYYVKFASLFQQYFVYDYANRAVRHDRAGNGVGCNGMSVPAHSFSRQLFYQQNSYIMALELC